MNKNEISVEDFQSRISNFIDKDKLATLNTQFEFNIFDNSDNIKMVSSYRRHKYLSRYSRDYK